MKSKALSPDVSVIVCTYNHGKWIERCLRSLVNQDFIKKEEYEVIFKYNQINKVIKIIKQFKLDIKYKNFNIESNVIFAVSKNKTDKVLNAFKKDHTIKIKKLKKQNEIT